MRRSRRRTDARRVTDVVRAEMRRLRRQKPAPEPPLESVAWKEGDVVRLHPGLQGPRGYGRVLGTTQGGRIRVLWREDYQGGGPYEVAHEFHELEWAYPPTDR